MSTPRLWSTWPFLPLIRRKPGAEQECGLLYDVFHRKGTPGFSATVFICNIFMLPPESKFLDLPKEVYDSVDEVYAAGWRVD